MLTRANGLILENNGILPMAVGNVYEVIQTAQAFWGEYNKKRKVTYDDGSVNLCNTAQTALDKCVADRNDYIIIHPDSDDYDLTTALTLTKKCVHLICPAGICGDIAGSSNACRIDQTGAYAVMTVSGQSVEVAGIWLKCAADQSGIEISASAHACNIHNNFVAMKTTSGSATAYGIHGTGESSNLMIHHNWVTVYSPTASQTVGGGIVLDNGTRAYIFKNIVNVGGFSNTMSVGISAGSGACSIVSDNDLIENLSGTGSASTLTVGVQIATGGVALRNTGCMTTPNNLLAGGTSSKTAVGNWGSASGNTIQDAG
jgi:hypothetical protein